MPVKRISTEGLEKLLSNQVYVPATSIIKVYSNDCHLCHNLQEYYANIADAYGEEEGVYFFAYNLNDDPSIEKKLNFFGTPTILSVKSTPNGGKKAKVNVLADPDPPQKETWYKASEIRDFIEKVKE